MVEINTTYEGGLHCKAVHKSSGVTIETDAPVDNRGKGESFSPTDLLATSLAVCYLTTMGIAAEDREINMKGATCRIEKHMSTDSPRRVVKLVAEIVFPAGIPFDKRGILEAVALHCPVSKSLSADIDVDLKLHFPDGQDMEEHTHH
ncbi:MAG TPA: OsmC family protein [Ignavibacteria bacterium]|nr:OsmC family protein [Ignavibacteria bacterium]